MTKDEIRNAILEVHPEWKGRIWVNRTSVTIRGLYGMWLGEPTANYTPRDLAHLLVAIEDELKHDERERAEWLASQPCHT